jgi:glycosyltransferase involved in cell wall biosynthesis
MFQGNSYQLISNAIDASDFSFGAQKRGRIREEFGFNDDTLVVGHVGSFWAVKNHTFLIDVFSILEKINNTAKLLLVGNGGRMEEIREKVKNLGLCDKVIFTGIRTDVSDLMQAMDIFVFPSLYEGLGIALIEAQAAGLPCVVSDTIPHEAYLTDLVDSESLSAPAENWAEKVLSKRAIPRTDRRAEIAAHGFDITTEAVKLQEFYLKAYEQNC